MIEAMKRALDALESIWVYGADTLSGPVRGQPDDRKFQRDGVAEMTKRARLGKEALRQAIETAEKQEPDELTIAYMSGLFDGKKKREWKSLTDEEIEVIGKDAKVLLAQFHTSVKTIDEMKDPTAQIMNLVIRQQGFNFAKAIEAKLREKNT